MACRQTMRDLIRPAIDGAGTVDYPAVARSVAEKLKADAAFVAAFTEEMLYPAVYDEVQRVAAETRKRMPDAYFATASGMIGKSVFRNQAKAFGRQFRIRDDFVEHVEPGRNVRLMEMTRSDLAVAARNRYRSASIEAVYGDLWSQLASRLTGSEKVGSAWNLDEINQLYDRIARQAQQPADTGTD